MFPVYPVGGFLGMFHWGVGVGLSEYFVRRILSCVVFVRVWEEVVHRDLLVGSIGEGGGGRGVYVARIVP